MAGLQRIRTLLADDEILVRRGVASLLAGEPDFEVVGEASNGQEAIERFQASLPELILMDVQKAWGTIGGPSGRLRKSSRLRGS